MAYSRPRCVCACAYVRVRESASIRPSLTRPSPHVLSADMAACRYVKSELYEKAAAFFARAAALQPGEIKWRLMVASCHRRSGALSAALEEYAAVHEAHPENLECEWRVLLPWEEPTKEPRVLCGMARPSIPCR